MEAFHLVRNNLGSLTAGRENNFNIIRILAALAVLFSHCFAIAEHRLDPLAAVIGVVSIGSIGVDMFFLISGFLVTASLLTKESLIGYVLSRILRVYPALITMVVLSVFGLGLIFTSKPIATYLASGATKQYLWHCSTMLYGVDYYLPGVFEQNPAARIVNGSLWSMPHELRMYCLLINFWAILRITTTTVARERVMPAILCAISVVWMDAYWQGLGIVLYFVLVGCFSAVSTKDAMSSLLRDVLRVVPCVAYLTFSAYEDYGIDGCLCALIAACIVATFTRFLQLSIIEMAILIASIGSYCFTLTLTHSETSKFLHLFCMFTMGASFWILRRFITMSRSYLWVAITAIGVSSLISAQVFFATYTLLFAYVIFYLAFVPTGRIRNYNRLGDYSYGLYIYAFPIQQAIVAWQKETSALPLFVASGVCTLVMAILSWHLIEKPALRLKANWGQPTRVAWGGEWKRIGDA